jgi:hypothetical protein
MAKGIDPNDPLEKAREALARLRDADDWDEPTGKTEVTVNLRVPPQPSQPEITVTKQDSDPPTPPDANTLTKNVSVLAKLLPKEDRKAFMLALIISGSILLALAKGWIRFGR